MVLNLIILLSNGWCIDCHRQKEVDMDDNDYYTEMHKNFKESMKV